MTSIQSHGGEGSSARLATDPFHVGHRPVQVGGTVGSRKAPQLTNGCWDREDRAEVQIGLPISSVANHRNQPVSVANLS